MRHKSPQMRHKSPQMRHRSLRRRFSSPPDAAKTKVGRNLVLDFYLDLFPDFYPDLFRIFKNPSISATDV
jgi:hypothetical protein